MRAASFNQGLAESAGSVRASAAFDPIADLACSRPARDELTMIERDDSFTDAFIPAGTAVRYDGLAEGGPEYGIVVHCWRDREIDAYDCYVAFLGPQVPTGKPSDKPYVLRYAALSLARMDALPSKVR